MTFTDLGCYGNPDVKTPSIDKLATEGMRFTKFYNPTPTCSPLRQSLYTGIYPIRNGAHPNHSQVYEGVKSLPHILSPLGYRVAIVGKRHEAPAEAFPFEMLGGSHGDSGKTPDGADLPLAKAREFIERDLNQPWCLVVSSNQPHTPWNRGDASAYPPETLTLPPYLVDTPATRAGLSKYYAEITYMDHQVGEVMRILRETGEKSETAFLWLSEQGSNFPFCKWTCYDTGIHAAAVMRWPGKIKANSESSALINYVDVVPTFVDLAGGKPADQDFDGKSFAAVLRGEKKTHNDFVFATHTTRGIYSGSEAYATRAITDGHSLFIRNLHADSLFQNTVTERDSIFKSWKSLDSDFARERVSSYQKRPTSELFDLKSDPWCQTNLAGDAGSISKQKAMQQELESWMKQQGDLGDATERDAENRQPKLKPWAKKNSYAN
ncbi:sulfatase [Arenicella sp.]|nr:sulfatase [Arenicella sp.]